MLEVYFNLPFSMDIKKVIQNCEVQVPLRKASKGRALEIRDSKGRAPKGRAPKGRAPEGRAP